MQQIKSIGIAIVVALAFALTAHVEAPTASAQGATVTQDNLVFQVPLFVAITCGSEIVTLTGNLHFRTVTVVNGNGFHTSWGTNAQNVSGEGSLGNSYNGNGATLGSTSGSFINGQYNTTYVNNFRIVGQKDNSYQVHVVIHVTINANGATTATVSQVDFRCSSS